MHTVIAREIMLSCSGLHISIFWAKICDKKNIMVTFPPGGGGSSSNGLYVYVLPERVTF